MVIYQNIFGYDLAFKTSEELFSYRSADKGTLFMLEKCLVNVEDVVLDLGCGYGLVGIACCKITKPENVVMCDIDPIAIDYAKQNLMLNDVKEVCVLQSDAYSNILRSDFTLILSNPPFHEDFSVPKTFIEQGYNKLVPNGRMFMVTKRLEWYKRKFIKVFGGVKIFRMDDYFVFMGIKSDRLKLSTQKRGIKRNV